MQDVVLWTLTFFGRRNAAGIDSVVSFRTAHGHWKLALQQRPQAAELQVARRAISHRIANGSWNVLQPPGAALCQGLRPGTRPRPKVSFTCWTPPVLMAEMSIVDPMVDSG
jgi:hypothetical protein